MERLVGEEARISIILSFTIGALVGLVVVAFILLTGRMAARMYPPDSSFWRRALAPTLGALASGYLLYRYFPDARGSGIPQTKSALFIHNGYISLRTVLGKFACCSLTLASGVSLGREGPSVHIGAGIASVLARRLGLPNSAVKAMLPVGCAAALAAAFNTPIAAVLFTLEEVLGDLHAPVLGSVVISSATSWMVLHLILGDEPLFHVPPYQLVNPLEFGVYALLGIIGGLGSVAFVKLLLAIRLWYRRLPSWTVWFQPATAGLLVGVTALAVPEVLGVGYDYVERVLGGDLAVRTLVLLAVLKIAATALCYSSGNSGGIFGPSLFIGAMIGGAVGSVAHTLLPLSTAGPGAYALIGMGTAFAGIIRTPLTSVIMIFEITRDYSIIVPLMISNLISFFVSQRLQRIPIYESLARQDGVHWPVRESAASVAEAPLQSLLRTGVAPLTLEADYAAAQLRMAELSANAFPVVSEGVYLGLIRAADSMSPGDAKILAPTLGETPAEYLYPDEPLTAALERMGSSGLDLLPVVSRADRRKLIGVVTLNDVLEAFGLAGAGLGREK